MEKLVDLYVWFLNLSKNFIFKLCLRNFENHLRDNLMIFLEKHNNYDDIFTFPFIISNF